MDYVAKYASPLGEIFLASDGENLTGLWFDNQKYFMNILSSENEERMLPIFVKVSSWLDRYFNGEKPEVDFSIKPRGSEFRQLVWNRLIQIPYGETITYGEIAEELELRIGKPMSAQAVGGAVGHNPISVIIPCHRVVGANGNLTGYAGGIDKKVYLLNLENKGNKKNLLKSNP